MYEKGFDVLAALEPRLRKLEADIKVHAERNRNIPKYCANAWWYGYPHTGFEGFKHTFIHLVGRFAELADERIRNSAAYDCAYDHLYNLLPNCKRGCACQTLAHPGAENLIR
jgi:hypothetical protein